MCASIWTEHIITIGIHCQSCQLPLLMHQRQISSMFAWIHGFLVPNPCGQDQVLWLVNPQDPVQFLLLLSCCCPHKSGVQKIHEKGWLAGQPLWGSSRNSCFNMSAIYTVGVVRQPQGQPHLLSTTLLAMCPPSKTSRPFREPARDLSCFLFERARHAHWPWKWSITLIEARPWTHEEQTYLPQWRLGMLMYIKITHRSSSSSWTTLHLPTPPAWELNPAVSLSGAPCQMLSSLERQGQSSSSMPYLHCFQILRCNDPMDEDAATKRNLWIIV